MKIKCLFLIGLIVISLSACSNSNEYYEIPLIDFKTEAYDEFQSIDNQSYFTLLVNNDFIDEISLNRISFNIPEALNIQNDSKVTYNFEVNDYQLCNEDLEIQYFDSSGHTSSVISCQLVLRDENITKEEFIEDSIDVYIIINYENLEGEGIIEKHLYAVISGILTQYRR